MASNVKILCPIKRVIDYQVKVRVKADGSGVETDNVPMSINPFDEIALEEAMRLKEAGLASEIIVVTIGTTVCEDICRKGLAFGADKALLIESNQSLRPQQVAKCLRAIVEQTKPDLVLMGKQAIDDDCNQTGQLLAGYLGWPQATFASKIEVDQQILRVEREVDSGMEVLSLSLPAVVTSDLRLNEPRYLSLPNIIKAKSKPLEIVDIDSLGCDLTDSLETISISAPKVREPGIRVKSVQELVQCLREKEGVIA